MILAKRITFLSLIITIGFFLWMGQKQEQFMSGNVDNANLPDVGYTAPGFSLLDIQEDEIVDLSNVIEMKSGTVVYFWTSWCPFCAASIGAMEDSYQDYGEDVNFIGVNVTNQDSISNAKKFLEEHGINFTNVLDEKGTVSSSYFVPPIPATVFINSSGVIIHRKMGAITKTEIDQYIQRFEGS